MSVSCRKPSSALGAHLLTAVVHTDEIHTWLESFGLGYNRNDPSTVRDECLPIIIAKGLVQAYGAPHEVCRLSAPRILSLDKA